MSIDLRVQRFALSILVFLLMMQQSPVIPGAAGTDRTGARQHRRTSDEEEPLGRRRYRTDKAAFEEATAAAEQMRQYQTARMAERGLRSPVHRRFLLVNLFEDGCFNPGKDEVAFDQFVAMARTSESPRQTWNEKTFRSSYEHSLGPRRQHFKSCGQLNNVLQQLLQAVGVAQQLGRTLVLPGFYFRKGLRRTRIDHFEEEVTCRPVTITNECISVHTIVDTCVAYRNYQWQPTSRYLNTSALAAAGFDTIELESFKQIAGAATGANTSVPSGFLTASITFPLLLIRSLGDAPARTTGLFTDQGFRFEEIRPAKFPFSFPQHSAPRWVEDRPGRPGSYTSWNLGQTAEWWRSSFIAPKPRRRKFKADASQEQEQETLDVLAFDTAVSFGLGQDGLRFEKKLLDIAAATIRFNNDVVARANEFAAGPQLKGSPYLAVHIRRGVDRQYEFCQTNEGREAYGWRVTTEMCYPTVQQVAEKIKRFVNFQRKRKPELFSGNDNNVVFLATDSPDPTTFEAPLASLLKAHEIILVQAAPEPDERHMDDLALLVDQLLCSRATAFLGNFPSTVTTTILQMRDANGYSRHTFDFFGSEAKHRKFLRDVEAGPLAVTIGPSAVHEEL